jgi:polysaccharide export outer membrane protein
MLFVRAATLAVIGCIVASAAGQDSRKPPKELVQYVRDAARLGLSPGQIRQNATTAGWPVAVVESALAAVSGGESTAPEATEAAAPVTEGAKTEPAKEPAKAPAATPAPVSTAPAERSAQPPVSDDEYRIGSGDVLNISVYKEPEASVPSAVVRPDGKIGLPLLKDVEVAGLTTSEAEKVITDKLSKLIPAADVTIVVTAIHSKKIYVVGAVKKEGPIAYTYPMKVMQALSEAGGLTDYAKRKKIYVLRNENGKDYRLPFDYDAVLRGERMELNIPLLPNDTLVVPH